MRNKFLKMTFMALCLSTSSALHAMNEDEITASCSSAIISYEGKYEIRRNDPYEKSSGSVTIRQEGDQLVLENFTLIPGSHYHDRMGEVIRDTNESSPFETENRQIANFVLSAMPAESIQLKFLGNPEGSMQYGAAVPFGGEERAPMHVRFRTEKNSFFGEMFHLTVESPYGIGRPAASPVEALRLFKVGSAEHDSLLERSRFFSTPKSSLESEKEILPFKVLPFTFNSSFTTPFSGGVPQGYQFVVDPGQPGIKHGPMSITLRGEGEISVAGDGYVFYQQLLKSEMVKLDGRRFKFLAEIKGNVPGAYLQYWDYPNPTKTKSPAYSNVGEWQTLELEFTVDASQSLFFLYPAILPAVIEGSELPQVEVKNVRLDYF